MFIRTDSENFALEVEFGLPEKWTLAKPNVNKTLGHGYECWANARKAILVRTCMVRKKSLCRPSVPEMTKSNQNDEESLRGSLSLPISSTSIPFRYMYPLPRG